MDYQIAYLNVYGNAGVLADEIQTILAGAELVDLNKQEISDDADVYLLVFEITQAAIPLKIMDVLENMEGKTVLCCVTCGMALHSGERDLRGGAVLDKNTVETNWGIQKGYHHHADFYNSGSGGGASGSLRDRQPHRQRH